MQTVFSHIIQKRLSKENEDVATEALAFILGSSETIRNGMMKFLRGIVPEMPTLRFKTQQTAGAIRPDMWGYSDSEPRLFVENKFWAGLTENQPVSYLKHLSEYTQPTILLIIAPAAREHALWRELNCRLEDAGISISKNQTAAGIALSATTQIGSTLAITSWTKVLSVLEHEAVDDPGVRGDIVQLEALCKAADIDAFTPISSIETSDQRTPAMILQLGSIVQKTVAYSVRKNVLSIKNLRPQAAWERIGRYASVAEELGGGPGLWIGVHFELWKIHGTTPLWIYFHKGEDFGCGEEVRQVLEPWAEKNGMLTVSIGDDFALALEVPAGEEEDNVIRALADKVRAIAKVIARIPVQSATKSSKALNLSNTTK